MKWFYAVMSTEVYFLKMFFYFNIKFTSELIIFDKDMMPECLDGKI